MQQNGACQSFDSAASWVILSPIERGIKEKIERVGTPLKEWDVNIYRGILTGFNEAFIIDETKRQELIAQDPKSADIIRPILRGRDIKRFGYNWAGLYMIATFPALHIDIELYPAIQAHLLSFGKERLEQTGQTVKVNNQTLMARKKTTNKWFETQDQIGYWEDFFKPKIIYPDIMRMPRKPDALDGYPYFYYDNQSFFVEATNFMMTGKDIDLVCSYLASDLGFYVFSKFYTGPQFDETGFRYKKAYLLNLVVPTLSKSYETRIRSEFSRLSSPSQFVHASVALNQLWYASIGLNSREIDAVTSYKSMLLEYSQRPFE